MKQWAHDYRNGEKGHIHKDADDVFVVAMEGAGGVRTAQSLEEAVEVANQDAGEASTLQDWKRLIAED